MIILGVIVGVLDGFGLAMFMPLLEMVNNPNEVSGSSLGKLKFLVNFMESFGISLNLATVLLVMIFFFVFKGIIKFLGGVKLGVGGLISAYKTTAQLTLEEADIVEKTIDKHFKITFDYKNMNKVMRIIKEKNIDIVHQKMELNCEIEIATRKKNAQQTFDIFSTLFEIEIEEIEE
jgi:hypothetical protein